MERAKAGCQTRSDNDAPLTYVRHLHPCPAKM